LPRTPRTAQSSFSSTKADIERQALAAQPDTRVDIFGEMRGHFVGVGKLAAALKLIEPLRANRTVPASH
jgi:hypothetical protein